MCRNTVYFMAQFTHARLHATLCIHWLVERQGIVLARCLALAGTSRPAI